MSCGIYSLIFIPYSSLFTVAIEANVEVNIFYVNHTMSNTCMILSKIEVSSVKKMPKGKTNSHIHR